MTREKGAPSLLFVTGAATRATDLHRELKDFNTANLRVAKLFAKHMKVEEQKDMLKKKTYVGVGTPNRL